MNADQIIERLNMQPHPEGGYYVESFRSAGEGRGACTAIYYLLKKGQRSHWHRVDADEIWHWYAGAPLTLRLSHDGKSVEEITLSADLLNAHQPQAVVPKDVWQSAECHGDWVLVGCTVSPAFEFAGFELAPEGWEPSG